MKSVNENPRIHLADLAMIGLMLFFVMCVQTLTFFAINETAQQLDRIEDKINAMNSFSDTKYSDTFLESTECAMHEENLRKTSTQLDPSYYEEPTIYKF